MFERYHDALPRGTCMFGAACALCVLAMALVGCTDSASTTLPTSHIDQEEVAVDHARCGACHRNGTRGNETYVPLDYVGVESLSLLDGGADRALPDGAPAEGLFIDQLVEESE